MLKNHKVIMSLLGLVLLVLLGTMWGVIIGIDTEDSRNGFCHSITEDSAPYDCYYDGETNRWVKTESE